jgi:hypothetical protein
MSQSQRQEDNLGDALMTTVAVDNLADASTSVLDAALGVLEETGTAVLDTSTAVLQHIPVVGVMFKLYKAGAAITQQVFARKLSRFLHELESVPFETRLAFINDFKLNSDFRQKVGDNLILLLDKADDIDKASLLDKLFTYYVTGAVDYSTYIRFALITNKAHLPDLVALRKSVYEEGICEPEFTPIEIEELSSVGILSGVMQANNHPFPYEGPTNPPSPDRLYGYFTLLGKQFSQIIKELY